MSQLTLYRDSNYRGGELHITGSTPNLKLFGFNDVISSLRVEGGTWTLFEHSDYKGYSVTVSAHGGPDNDGTYPNPAYLGGRNDKFSSIKKNSNMG